MRYQVIYSKNGLYPAHHWCDSLDDANAKAAMWKKAGYNVDIWEHTKSSARPVVLWSKNNEA